MDNGVADGEVAAWGMAYEDGGADVVGVGGRRRFSLGSAERAVWWFGQEPGVTARLVWFAEAREPTFI
ncbi:hypothetical protein [Streptomyces sp. NPDC003077]|uniref:hypothetical protein n=1 Tax=Streptomyces sp. NPDC003077 TaxID=3154443 RepID=UPI0033A35688